MSQWHGGKGSAPRKNADRKAYADNWDNIFGKKNENTNEEENKDIDAKNKQVNDISSPRENNQQDIQK